MSKGTQGNWKVRTGADGIPLVVAYGLGKYRDESRTVAIMKDNSILSHEDAELIVEAVLSLRLNTRISDTEASY